MSWILALIVALIGLVMPSHPPIEPTPEVIGVCRQVMETFSAGEVVSIRFQALLIHSGKFDRSVFVRGDGKDLGQLTDFTEAGLPNCQQVVMRALGQLQQ